MLTTIAKNFRGFEVVFGAIFFFLFLGRATYTMKNLKVAESHRPYLLQTILDLHLMH
jgi:hypothetical protein